MNQKSLFTWVGISFTLLVTFLSSARAISQPAGARAPLDAETCRDLSVIVKLVEQPYGTLNDVAATLGQLLGQRIDGTDGQVTSTYRVDTLYDKSARFPAEYFSINANLDVERQNIVHLRADSLWFYFANVKTFAADQFQEAQTACRAYFEKLEPCLIQLGFTRVPSDFGCPAPSMRKESTNTMVSIMIIGDGYPGAPHTVVMAITRSGEARSLSKGKK